MLLHSHCLVHAVMSYDGDTHTVLKGVTHGAVDFLIKPVRMEELSNMWQHVVRKRARRPSEERGQDGAPGPGPASKRTGSISSDGGPMPTEAMPPDTTAAPGPTPILESKKRTTEDRDASAAPPPGTKRPRVHWSSQMHSQFVAAVNKLGIDKAVPKKILELMTVEGLTRENVASHLQKYRLYLKKAAKMDGGVAPAEPAPPDPPVAPAAAQPAPGTPPPEPAYQSYQGANESDAPSQCQTSCPLPVPKCYLSVAR